MKLTLGVNFCYGISRLDGNIFGDYYVVALIMLCDWTSCYCWPC